MVSLVLRTFSPALVSYHGQVSDGAKQLPPPLCALFVRRREVVEAVWVLRQVDLGLSPVVVSREILGLLGFEVLIGLEPVAKPRRVGIFEVIRELCLKRVEAGGLMDVINFLWHIDGQSSTLNGFKLGVGGSLIVMAFFGKAIGRASASAITMSISSTSMVIVCW